MKSLIAILSFCFLCSCTSTTVSKLSVVDEGKLILRKDGKDVLYYNYQTIYPPAGVDTFYKKSGYIHPVFSPAGNVLTTIQPSDHIHHYGVWNAWTRMEVEGETYDLWNLQEHQGTVRAGDVLEVFEEKHFAGFTIRQQHIIFTAEGERNVMNEDVTVCVRDYEDGFLWDFKSVLVPQTDIVLKEYRYGGVVYRATPEWVAETCNVVSSGTADRDRIDGTTARWIYVNGMCKEGDSGLLIMGHPANHNAPEPLRIWDEHANNGRGDVMINFAPVKFEEWALEAGNTYLLRYRFFAYDGFLTPEKAEELWNEYAMSGGGRR